jgi:large subunit ribosomal protein L10
MSKLIKQMQMDALDKAFTGVRDLVVLSVKGLSSQAEHGLRMALRKKKVSLHVVKNSLARLVFQKMGLKAADDPKYWLGPTTLAWGTDSLGELSRAVDAELRNAKTAPVYKEKVTVKGAIAEGQALDFDIAVKLPTRAEAIGSVLAAILGPAGAIAGCLTGPAAQIAGQVQAIAEKKEEAPAATSA